PAESVTVPRMGPVDGAPVALARPTKQVSNTVLTRIGMNRYMNLLCISVRARGRTRVAAHRRRNRWLIRPCGRCIRRGVVDLGEVWGPARESASWQSAREESAGRDRLRPRAEHPLKAAAERAGTGRGRSARNAPVSGNRDPAIPRASLTWPPRPRGARRQALPRSATRAGAGARADVGRAAAECGQSWPGT